MHGELFPSPRGATADSGWIVRCHASDDPWPVYQSGDASGAPSLKAFYNPARNFFTGVVTPSIGVDLPPFYTAAMIPRAAGGAALLFAGIDGKVQLVENGAMRHRGWNARLGQRFCRGALGCGAGTQVIASSSGEAMNDSLRAFEIPALEAVPASGPLAMDGTVTALWTAQDARACLRWCAMRQVNTRWTVLRRFAISFLLVSRWHLRAGARTRPHYGGTLHVETAGDAVGTSRWNRAKAGVSTG